MSGIAHGLFFKGRLGGLNRVYSRINCAQRREHSPLPTADAVLAVARALICFTLAAASEVDVALLL